MRIAQVEIWKESLPLTRPYTIAFQTVSAVDLFFVRLVTVHGIHGLGSASPAPNITNETPAACAQALRAGADVLHGQSLVRLGTLLREVGGATGEAPAAQAALDMALYDAFTRHLDVPLVDYLGRFHTALPTSITIGIKPVADTLAEADEYVGRGFRVLKVKLGHDLDTDLQRLHALRERFGQTVVLRVDANQGYTRAETLALMKHQDKLHLEFVEQPMPQDAIADMQSLPRPMRARTAADESLQHARDAIRLLQPEPAFGIYNIKLMKAGGLTEARRIATVAELGDLAVMWGCMDESHISISAALHAAYASPATRYLDLDGSLDLSRDVARGGFSLNDGIMTPTDAAGLGVALR